MRIRKLKPCLHPATAEMFQTDPVYFKPFDIYNRTESTFREHAMLVKTAGVKHMVVLINKMDDPTVGWDKAR